MGIKLIKILELGIHCIHICLTKVDIITIIIYR